MVDTHHLKLHHLKLHHLKLHHLKLHHLNSTTSNSTTSNSTTSNSTTSHHLIHHLKKGGRTASILLLMAIKHIIVLFVETPRKFIIAKLSIRKPGSSSVLIICDLFNSHALFIYKSVVICWLASFEI